MNLPLSTHIAERLPSVVLSPCTRHDDVQALLAMLQVDEIRSRVYGSAPQVPSIEALRHHWMQGPAPGETRRVVREHVNGPALGCVMVDPGEELSYFIDPSHWGRGLATLAVHALLRERAAARQPPLQAWVDRRNGASRTVLERAGFAFAGLQHRGPLAAAWLRYRQPRPSV